jgi:hypothetical protein
MARTGNSSSQSKVFCGTAENGIQTTNEAKYANKIKKIARLAYFAAKIFTARFPFANQSGCVMVLAWQASL